MDLLENLCNDALICISTITERNNSNHSLVIRVMDIERVATTVASLVRKVSRTESMIYTTREKYRS